MIPPEYFGFKPARVVKAKWADKKKEPVIVPAIIQGWPDDTANF